MVRRKFDIFEKFPDGSISWRIYVFGRFQAERKLQELAEHSENEFLAIDNQSDEPLPKVARQPSVRAKSKAANG